VIILPTPSGNIIINKFIRYFTDVLAGIWWWATTFSDAKAGADISFKSPNV
jgi:thiamine transporter ThiT